MKEMNIQLILLCICLTLKVTAKTKVPLAEISKVYNALAIIQLADDVLKFIDDRKNEEVTDLIYSFKNEAENSISGYYEDDSITNKVTNETVQIEDAKQLSFEFHEQVHLINFIAIFQII